MDPGSENSVAGRVGLVDAHHYAADSGPTIVGE